VNRKALDFERSKKINDRRINPRNIIFHAHDNTYNFSQ
jgi:hypothetical protein